MADGPGSAFLCFNMERTQEDTIDKKDNNDLQFMLNQIANESNEAVVGDLITMVDDSHSRIN